MKVLIVDDSKAMRMIVKRTIAQTDLGKVDSVEAENGAVALELATKQYFDLIFCDWNMPEMTGIEFLQALREAGVRSRFGFITSETGEDIKKLAMDSGAQFIMAKPFNAEMMHVALAEAAVN